MYRHAHILGLSSVSVGSFALMIGAEGRRALVLAGLLAAAAVASLLLERQARRRAEVKGAAAPQESIVTTKRILMLMLAVGLVAYIGGGSTFSTFSAETANTGSTAASGTLTMSDQVNAGTACLSANATSLDNYQGGTPGVTTGACDIPLTLTNQAPGVFSGNAKITIANTGSLDASQLLLYAPYANATLATQVSSGSTVSSIATTAIEGNVVAGDTIELDYGGQSIQMVAAANVSPGKTAITIANPGSLTGTISSGSANVTSITTTNLRQGMTVTGANIPANTTVLQVNASSIVMSNNAGGTGSTSESLTFSVKAAQDFKVGTRVYDTSSNASPTTTECFDTITQTSPVSGATKGSDLNFNGTDIGDGSHWDSTDTYCRTLLFWVQEQSQPVPTQTVTLTSGNTTVSGLDTTSLGKYMTVTGTNIPANTTISSITGTPGPGGSVVLSNAPTGSGSSTLTFTANYCWWGLGSSSSAVTSLATTNGMCLAPISAGFSGATNIVGTTTSLTFATALKGNVKSGDILTISEPRKMVVRCTAGQDAYIGATTVTVSGCTSSATAWVPATGENFTSAATIVDTTINNGLNSDTTDTISNFDTSKNSSNKIEMPALTANAGGPLSSGSGYSNVELAKHGTTGDTRVFYVGVFFPAGSGSAQNATQGLSSQFGLSWKIQQG
jgi:hypothetical protein